MLNSAQEVEECDATKAKQNYKSWKQKYFITNRMNEEIASASPRK